MDWAEEQAETIIDGFVAYYGPDDLLVLQQNIAAALRQAYLNGTALVPTSPP